MYQVASSFNFNPDISQLERALNGSSRFDTTIAVQQIASQFEGSLKVSGLPVSCTVGCSHCCKSSSIQITGTEALIIASATGRNVRTTSGGKKLFAGVACTFLSPVGHCTIYDIRPATCRALVSIDDPQKCLNEVHREAFSSDHVFPILMNLISKNHHKVLKSRLGTNMDIREAFPPSA